MGRGLEGKVKGEVGERDLCGGLRGRGGGVQGLVGMGAGEFGEGVKECVQDVKWCVGERDIRIMGKMEFNLWGGWRGTVGGEGDVGTTVKTGYQF